MPGEYKIEPLFAEPLFRIDIGDAITEDQIAYIRTLKMVRNPDNWISEDTYIFSHPQLARLANTVQEVLDFYAKEVMGIPQQIYVTQSWSLMNEPNTGMHAHSHSNSILSGSIYYTDLPDPPARMVFTRHKTYQQIDLQPTLGIKTIYNSPTTTVTPRKNEMFLFASDLTHLVEPNATAQPRYAIAFNTFVKGKLGGYRNISELTLP